MSAQLADPPGVVDRSPRTGLTGVIRIRLRAPARRRNLELVLLIGAFILAGGALALVDLGAIGRVGGTMLALEGGLAVLLIGVHVVLRVVAPDADPFLLPIATLLNGLGIAEISRIDIAKHWNGWDAFAVRQVVWTAMAIVIAVAVLLVIRNHRVLQRYRYIAMFAGIVLLLLPMLPGIGRTVNGARVWIGIGPFTFQPGELGQDRAGHLLRRLPRHGPRLAVDDRAQDPRDALPARARPRPDPRHLGRRDGRHRVPARPRHRPALLRPLPGDDLRRHRPAQLDRARPAALHRRRGRRQPPAPLRRRPIPVLARRLQQPELQRRRRQLPAGAGHLRARGRRTGRHRARPGPAGHHPRWRRATISWPASARSWG